MFQLKGGRRMLEPHKPEVTKPVSVPERFDTVVLGAGISGLTLSHDLAKAGESVLLVDEYDAPGGNHVSVEISGRSFDIGAIFFWTGYPQFQMFPALSELVVPVDWSLQRVTPTGRVARYPVDMRADFFGHPLKAQAAMVSDIISARLKGQSRESALAFLEYYLGDRLMQESGILNYVKRFYGLPAESISYDFAKTRMRPVEYTASLSHLASRTFRKVFAKKQHLGSELCVARPKTGFSAYYDAAVGQLHGMGVKTLFGAKLDWAGEAEEGEKLRVNGESIAAGRIISTLPLVRAASLTGCKTTDEPRSKGLHSLFCQFRGKRGFDSLILYNFHRAGRWKRLTMHSDYYGPVDDWEYLSVEITADDPDESPEALFDDFRGTARAFGLFDGELELLGHRHTDFAYPIYDQGSARRRDALIKQVSDAGLEVAGRQGRFEYLPTSAETIRSVRASSEA